MNYRRIVSADYTICERQGKLYQKIAHDGCDMEWFSNAYLNSRFCKGYMDTLWSRLQWAHTQEVLDHLLPEISPVKKNEQGFFDEDVAYWIGFTYRMLYIETQVPSAELIKKVPFEMMCRYYPGLHTVAEEMAIDIICEDNGLSLDVEYLKKMQRMDKEAEAKVKEEFANMDELEDL